MESQRPANMKPCVLKKPGMKGKKWLAKDEINFIKKI